MGEPQKTQRVLDGGGPGEARMTATRGAEPMAANPDTESPSASDRLMEEVCERGNLQRALKRVKANKGAPGVDGMTVQALPAFLREHWPSIRASLLEGTYKPKPVRRVETPKPDGGGVRKLGIRR
jgi:RNA-directed DNA polymerase